MTVTPTRVRLVSGREAVGALLATLPAEMRRSAFHHPNWIRAWLATEGHAKRRTIAVVVECVASARPLMVLPLTLEIYGPAHYWAPLDHGVCDYNGTWADPDFRPSTAEMHAIWRRIVAALPDDASFLMIDKLPADLGGRHEALIDATGLRRSHVVRHPLALDADFETLRATRFCQTNVRSLDRKRRKLGRKGRLTFEVASGAAAMEAFETLLVWRAERYGERPACSDFYRRLVEAGDPARVLWLALDGRPISACFGVTEPGAFRLLALGHDEAFKNWSPGLLVIEDAIAWAIGEGAREFDFTIGSEAYKFAFGVTPEPLWLLADEFGPHGSAMLRLLLTRNLVASKLKRWIDVNGPRKREPKAVAAD